MSITGKPSPAVAPSDARSDGIHGSATAIRFGASGLHGGALTAAWFALTIFTGAFLLFIVQPLLGKFILPWFGGSAAVWTCCLLFFQLLLLGGYAYAHLSTALLPMRWQAIVHVLLLVAAVCMLPIAPSTRWEPAGIDINPALYILLLLTACVGLPYLALSATGPLLQAWFARTHPGRSPYRLYALSNLGSLLALVAYPLAVEPGFTRMAQTRGWSIGLLAFACMCTLCAWITFRARGQRSGESAVPLKGKTRIPLPAIFWIALPMAASTLLLATTNKLCQEVTVVPFLWVAPLGVYLLSFVISFDNPRWYRREIFGPLLALALFALCLMIYQNAITSGKVSALAQIAIYLVTLFACCMACHGELFRMRPAAELTAYYLCIASGGALGGIVVAVAAPLLFNTYLELSIGLFACAVLVAIVLYLDRQGALARGRKRVVWYGIFIATVLLGCVMWIEGRPSIAFEKPVLFWRDFYGTLSVWHRKGHTAKFPGGWTPDQIVLRHGGITHGIQFPDPDKHRLPTAYYGPEAGVGRALLALRERPVSPLRPGLNIAAVGLGAGTLATYTRPEDLMTFYELNPSVERIANDHFFFLKEARGKVLVTLGDARLSLQRQPPQQLDCLVLDAFSGDSIPVHLLTREAFELYLQHLLPGGIVAVHISNNHVELEPVLAGLAEHFHLQTDVIIKPFDREAEQTTGQVTSKWVLLTRDAANFRLRAISDVGVHPAQNPENLPLWTDERTALLPLLH